MSKRTRTLLLSAVALVVLAALLVTLLLLPAPENGDTEPTDTPDTTVTVLEKEDSVKISNVKITLPNETFTIVADKSGTLAVQGYEGLPQSAATYDALADALLDITALRAIDENPEQPETFGFKGTPSTATVEVAYSDNSTYAFELGDMSPSGSGHYLRAVGSSAIYLMDSSFGTVVAAPSTAYLSMAPLTAPSTKDDSDEVVVRDVTLSGSVRPETMVFQISDVPPADDTQAQVLTGFYLTRPYYRNVQTGTKLVGASAYYGFTANTVAKVRPTAADLSTYGLTKPYSACTANISVRKTTKTADKTTGKETTTYSFYNTFEYTVKLGNTLENGDRYAVVYHGDEMIPLLYTVTPSALPWAETQYNDLADPLLFFVYIDQVQQMSVTANGTTTVFALTHNPDAEDRDDQLKVVANGKTYSTPSFRTLYAALMELSRNGDTDAKPTGTPLLSINLKTDSTAAHTGNIHIYDTAVGKYTVVHDTGETYLVDAKSVTQFLNTYADFLAGKEI